MEDLEKRMSSTVSFNGGKISCLHLLQVTLTLQILGIVIPYMLNLQRHEFDPPLPFISQAVGCAPENGLFTLLMVPASFLGFILSFAIHASMHCAEKFPKILHQASFCCCMLYFLSWIFISAFPFTFTDLPNKYEWVCSVLWEHMFGALLMLGSCVFFAVFQSALHCYLNIQVNRVKTIAIALVVLPTAATGIYTLLRLAFEELAVEEGVTLKDITYQLPSKFSFYYVVTSVCEWILVSSMWFSLAVFSNRLKGSNILICIRQKNEEQSVQGSAKIVEKSKSGKMD